LPFLIPIGINQSVCSPRMPIHAQTPEYIPNFSFGKAIHPETCTNPDGIFYPASRGRVEDVATKSRMKWTSFGTGGTGQTVN